MGIEVLPVKESARRSAPAVVSNALAADLVAALRKRVRGEVRFDAGSRALYATDLSIYRQPPIGVVIDNRAAPRRDGNESRDEWQYYISGKARMTVVGTGERARTMNQFKMFAELVREGSWIEASIDRAMPDRKPLPKPQWRQIQPPRLRLRPALPEPFPLRPRPQLPSRSRPPRCEQ